jgi:cytochrome bd-type quinol oxidase subunit 1
MIVASTVFDVAGVQPATTSLPHVLFVPLTVGLSSLVSADNGRSSKGSPHPFWAMPTRNESPGSTT